MARLGIQTNFYLDRQSRALLEDLVKAGYFLTLSDALRHFIRSGINAEIRVAEQELQQEG